jgi:hypothetical protein
MAASALLVLFVVENVTAVAAADSGGPLNWFA